MYKCKKCGYKTSFKSLMVSHLKDHRKSMNRNVVYGYDSDIDINISESVFLDSCDFSSSDSFSGGGGSFGGGGASGGWDSGDSDIPDSGSCGGD